MLMITEPHDADGVHFKLAGALAGDWATEFERCWREATGSTEASHIVIDLAEVTFVDEIGKALLSLMVKAGALCVLAGIGMGTFLASFSRSQQQAQLMSFFVNPPLAMLSGATTPLDAMPEWMQSLTLVNPVRHFATIARAVMLKGAGIEILYPNLLALIGFAVLLVAVSAWRFRKQLG